MSQKGTVLRIEKISLNDGKGMRTVVFLKGCPLRCAWCSTPESHKQEREVYYMKQRCILCGACVAACPSQALTIDENHIERDPDGVETVRPVVVRDPSRCTNCFKCVDVCNYRAQQIYGKEMTTEQVMREVLKDEVFYFFSGGGLTLSGGDIFCQTDFAEDILKSCDDSCIDTCAELDLFTTPENVKRIIPYLDMIYVDLKCMDSAKHKEWTSQSNEIILENLKLASQICKKNALHIRVPFIEGVNDDPENLRKTAEFCDALPNCAELEFLPYHRLGLHAYEQLNRPYPLGDRKPMNRYHVYEKMSFLLEKDHPYDIKISNLPLYSSQTGVIPVTKEELEK